MAIALVQSNIGTAANDAGATSIAANTTATVAAGHFIVAAISVWSATGTISSVSGGGLTWAVDVQGNHSSANPGVAIASAQAPSGLASGTSITVNYSASVSARGFLLATFSGVKTSAPLGNTSALTSVVPGPFTFTTPAISISAGSVLIGAAHEDQTTTHTYTSGAEVAEFGDGVNFRGSMGYRVEASAASYSIAGTSGVNTSNKVALSAEYQEEVAVPPNIADGFAAPAGMFSPTLIEQGWFH